MDASTPPPRPGTDPHERTDAAASLEHSKVAGGSATVDAQLRVGAGFSDDDMELSRTRFVATSHLDDFGAALIEVRGPD